MTTSHGVGDGPQGARAPEPAAPTATSTHASSTDPLTSDSASTPPPPEENEPAPAPAVEDASPPAETPAATWDDLGISSDLRARIDAAGWAAPTEVQAACFPPIAEGRDVLVESHTGSGKTGAFLLPWIDRRLRREDPAKTGVQFLALTPTRELAKQVCDELERLAPNGAVRAIAIYGGTAMQPQFDALRAGVHAVVGTPGRILDHIRRRSLDLSRVNMVVLDEADEMLSMGFLEDIRSILDACNRDRQTTLFSATIPRDIERICKRYMRNFVPIRLRGDSASAAEIEHVYYGVSGSMKPRDLLDVIELEEPRSAIVFCNTREQTNFVASFLVREGYPAEPLSSDLSQRARERVMRRMREGKVRFLVATDVAARGIDISHVSHVINYAFPENPESYVHRTGRTGRAGRAGRAISLIAPQDLANLYQLRLVYPSIRIDERSLPPEEVLAEQRKQVKLDRLSQAFPEKVAPEWVLLARHLISDPRGERIVGLLLERALRKQHAPSAAERAERAVEEESADQATATERSVERGGRRRRRRRGREETDARPEAAPGVHARQPVSGATDGHTPKATEPADALDGATTEPQAPASEPALETKPDAASKPREAEVEDAAADQETAPAERKRRRRRRRSGRKRRGGAGTPEAGAAHVRDGEEDEPQTAAAAAADDTEGTDAQGVPGEAAPAAPTDTAGETKPGRRRRRRRRRSRPPEQRTGASQDEIVIDIDEQELEIVRSEFGEIDEMDELTLKGRRRAVIDTIQDEVELEDVSDADARRLAPTSEAEEAEEEAAEEETEAAPEGQAAPEAKAATAETEAAESGRAPSKKKRRRRRRRKKKAPPPPELLVPPHKDFWEAWSLKFSYREFEDDVWLPKHGHAAEPEPPPEQTAPAASNEADPAKSPPPASVTDMEAEAEPLVRVRLNVGRSQGKKAAHIREFLALRVGLEGRSVRDLTVREATTVFRVPAVAHEAVLAGLDGHDWDGHVLRVTLPDGLPASVLRPQATSNEDGGDEAQGAAGTAAAPTSPADEGAAASLEDARARADGEATPTPAVRPERRTDTSSRRENGAAPPASPAQTATTEPPAS